MRGGRSGHRGAPSGQGRSAVAPTAKQLIDEAEQLQQQGERRKGADAAAKFEAAVAKYAAALETVARGGAGGGALTDEELLDARFGLAECNQLWADALTEAAATLPDDHLTPDTERAARTQAASLLVQAVRHYVRCQPGRALEPVPPPPHAGTAASGDGGGGGHGAGLVAAAGAAAAEASAATAAMRADAGVDCGNSLASLGEVLEEELNPLMGQQQQQAGVQQQGGQPLVGQQPAGVQQGGPGVGVGGWLPLASCVVCCYRTAAECYRGALAKEDDALTLSNLGDVLVQCGSLLYGTARAVRQSCTAQQPEVAAAAAAAVGGDPLAWAAAQEAAAQSDFAAAVAAYEGACALTDSSAGDDLPGLLCNWGAGLLSMANCLQDDPAARLPLLESAAGRLSAAAAFDRADTAPLVALGDVLSAAGEAAEALAAAEAAGGQGRAGVAAAGGDGVQGLLAAAEGHYRGALERGYGAALAIRRAEPEALVGCGEVHLALCRLARRAGAGPETAARHATEAAAALCTALAAPTKLGGWRARCDVRYNAACTMALAGREQEAAPLFARLLACGAVTPGELAADEDLAPCRGAPWLQQLLGVQY